jgi:hypothetical protein
MTLKWLSQGQILGLAQGHVYQARWLVRGQGGDFPCPATDATINQAQTILSTLGTVVSPNYSTNWELPAVFKLPNAQVFDQFNWPADRREVPPVLMPQGATNLCPIWTQSVPTLPMNIPLETIQNALAPLGGILLNLWDNTTGQRIYDRPAVNLVPGQPPVIIPGQPPPPVVPGNPPLPPPPTPIPSTEEKKSVNPVLIGVGLVVGVLVLGAIATR